MCLHIAEQIELHFSLRNHAKYDVDKAAKIIEKSFPLSYAEAEEEWEKTEKEIKAHYKKKGPIMGERLRTALGLTDKNVNLCQVLEAAIERINKLNEILRCQEGLREEYREGKAD